MANTCNVTAITLGARKYGDARRIITFFTRERGKMEATAQGIGKPGSKLAAAVEPFTVSRLMLAETRSLHRLSQAEVLEAFLPLRSDMTRYGYASHLLELVSVSTESGDPLPELFEDLREALRLLVAGTDEELLLWAFTLRLLHHHGSAFDPETCVECSGQLAGQCTYTPGTGGFLCCRCAPHPEGRMPLEPATVAAVRSLRSLPLDRVGRIALRPEQRREVARLVRVHTDHYIGGHLRTRVFLDQVTRSRDRVIKEQTDEQ